MPFAGAEVNMILFSTTVYDFADALVDGYCVTPSIVTKTSSAEGGVFVKVKLTVVPSPVRLSIVLSDISKLPATSPINDANTLSVAAGAILNTIVESASIPYAASGC